MMKKRFYVFLVFALIITLCGCSKNSGRVAVGYLQVCSIDYSVSLPNTEAYETPIYENVYDLDGNLLFARVIANDKVYVQENRISGVTISKALELAGYQGKVVEKTIEVMDHDQLLKSTKYDANNNIISNIECIYDENWNLLEDKCTTSDNSVSYWHKYEYENGKRVAIIDLDSNGQVRMKRAIIDQSIEEEFDDQNRVVKRVVLQGDEIKLVSQFEYYTQDGIDYIETTIARADGTIMNHSIRSVEEEKDSFDRVITRKSTEEFEYLSDEAEERSTYTNVEKFDEFSRLVNSITYENGTMTTSISYSYTSIYEN